MKKKRHNSKSRTVSNVEIDDSSTKEIAVNIDHHADKYDSCNALVLPSKKRKTKSVIKNKFLDKLLSKKRRKQLEKVVDRKQKKAKRNELIEQLAKVQVPAAELQQYVSFTSVQNKGLKRHLQELEAPETKLKRMTDEDEEALKKRRSNSIRGSNKKKRLAILNNVKQIEAKRPDVIGFTDSSDESDIDNENKDEVRVLENDDENKDEACFFDYDNKSKDKANVFDSASGSWSVINKENYENNSMKNTEDEIAPNETRELKRNDEDNDMKNAENIATSSKSQKCKKSTKKVKKQQQSSTPNRIPVVHVPVNRKPEIQAVRSKLPIIFEECDIMEKINENPVVIITGETGSGKTTQIPQFLYERGYAQNKMIGITEPRRIAAMSMSKRVAEEMNLSQSEVSYQIRFEKNCTENTKIKFMTDGILLKEIQSDHLLEQYSAIILDEAHERTITTDVLIGLLSRLVPLREKRNDPLKLIIMSATLRVEEFVENKKLFKVKPPVHHIEKRQYDIKYHHNKKTNDDYVNDALHKTKMIHKYNSEGGILVFLTGQQEVERVVRELRETFPARKDNLRRVKQEANKTIPKKAAKKEDTNNSDSDEKDENNSDSDENDSENSSDSDADAKEALRRYRSKQKKSSTPAKIDLDDYAVIPSDDTKQDNDDDSLDEDDEIDFAELKNAQPMWVLPLYSALAAYEQAKVFRPPPQGCRLCVVSTNVAETSLTIPGIKYVVDSGRCKEKVYDKVTGVSTFQIRYISKASANQRSGRAGRTGSGHCYRLYSSAVYQEFKEYSEVEILMKPLDDLLLQMKAMNINNVVDFPFPTPPDIEQLKSAERRLTILRLLEECPDKGAVLETYQTKITELGHLAAVYPVAPRYGKMLALSKSANMSIRKNLMEYTICLVAALSVQQALDIRNREKEREDPLGDRMRQFRESKGQEQRFLGDAMYLLKVILFAEIATSQGQSLAAFCKKHDFQHKAIVEIRQIRWQLTKQIRSEDLSLNLSIEEDMPPPSEGMASILRTLMFQGFMDNVARKICPSEAPPRDDIRYAYRTTELEDRVWIHPASVLRDNIPFWVVYQEIYETSKKYMRHVTQINPQWVANFLPDLCNFSEPLKSPEPRYDVGRGKVICYVTGTFGKAALELPPCIVEHPLNENGIKLFVFSLLDGKVFSKLNKFVPSLETPHENVMKPWAKLNPCLQAIIEEMMVHQIMNKQELLEIWTSSPKFLLSSYLMWLPQSLHSEVTDIWPPKD